MCKQTPSGTCLKIVASMRQQMYTVKAENILGKTQEHGRCIDDWSQDYRIQVLEQWVATIKKTMITHTVSSKMSLGKTKEFSSPNLHGDNDCKPAA